MSSTEHHSNPSHNWLIFFLVCFCLTMAIGIWAIFCYHCNAPETKPGGGGHSGMILPQNREYTLHAGVFQRA